LLKNEVGFGGDRSHRSLEDYLFEEQAGFGRALRLWSYDGRVRERLMFGPLPLEYSPTGLRRDEGLVLGGALEGYLSGSLFDDPFLEQ
jgi:hypothetical protein